MFQIFIFAYRCPDTAIDVLFGISVLQVADALSESKHMQVCNVVYNEYWAA